jgi:hypothetical protein
MRSSCATLARGADRPAHARQQRELEREEERVAEQHQQRAADGPAPAAVAAEPCAPGQRNGEQRERA